MGYIFLSLGILLLVTTVLLWRLSRIQMHDFTVYTLLLPRHKVETSLIPPKPNPILAWFKGVAMEFLWKLAIVWVLLTWWRVAWFAFVSGGIATCTYLFIRGQIWLGLIVLILTLSVDSALLHNH
ncbi:MAG TPA: hypothetical protein VEP90_14865 [Methylomirabilota bacterium]|nr:hypothetical protein [Methylomirabilota bacterium]